MFRGLIFAAASLLGAAAYAGTFSEWAAFGYEVYENQTYLTVENHDLGLDVYMPQNSGKPAPSMAPKSSGGNTKVIAGSSKTPVLMYIHGGGWAYNNRQDAQLRLWPFLEKGYAVVNIDYRKIDSATAPAAVIDARCALNWIRQNAERFQFDISRIIVSGNSAGGHLAMMNAFAADSGHFDRLCWDGEGPRVAAVINWYGISDVADLIQGPNIHAYAVQWINDTDDPMALAKRVSPLSYISKGLPPVLSIHGNMDKVVPYTQATRLHAALQKAGVPNELLTMPGKGHGDFSREEVAMIYQHIWAFLQANKLMP